MRVCLVCAEFFGWGTSGGFGFATRMIGRQLANKGIDMYAVIPRPAGEPLSRVELDGVRIIGIERSRLWSANAVFREIDADIYHSQQPSLLSALAQWAMPDRVHVATMRDPRSARDWWTEFTHPTRSKLQVLRTLAFYENPLVHRAIRRMQACYVPADYLAAKSQNLYRLASQPEFMPTPVFVPGEVHKTNKPMICFVGRWDRVKRPEAFFDLARRMPDIQFVAIGKAHNLDYEQKLRQHYGDVANLEMVGYIDQFGSSELSEHLGRAWILVNNSAKEALPNTFVEAAAHRCAIVAALDPDGFASRFGYHVTDGDYARGIRHLLEEDRWRECGQAGYEYVNSRNELELAADRHIASYRQLLGSR